MTQEAIPMVDLAAEVGDLWPEFVPELERVLRSGHFIMGPEVSAFEGEFQAYLGVAHRAVGVNSGTDALVIALRALGIREGDEVVTTPFTFVATGSSILRVGATPVFCDIDHRTFNLDTARVADAIGPKTKAVIPVHLFGHPCDMDALGELARSADLLVVEDVAQALTATYRGRKVGTLGDASAFSFFPSKNLGAYGDAGLLTVRDPEAGERAAMLRVHGARRKYHNELLGYNSRLDALQAAILRVKLRHLDAWTQQRRAAAVRYGELLAEVPDVLAPQVAEDCEHSFHQYTVRVPSMKRAPAQEALNADGIACMVYYPVLLPNMPLFTEFAHDLPEAVRAAEEVLSLPIWPGITMEQQTRVVESLARGLASA